MFDTTISVGNLLQIATMLGGGLYFLWRVQLKLDIMNNTQMNFAKAIEKMDMEITKLSLITVDIARQDERMNAQDRRVQELSNKIESFFRHSPSSRRSKG